jgi:hypothetical protein
MAETKLHPLARELFASLGRIGHKVIAAGISKALEEARAITADVDRRVERGRQAAERMARGEPFRREDETQDNDDEEEIQ